jgi:hypothetical protein
MLHQRSIEHAESLCQQAQLQPPLHPKQNLELAIHEARSRADARADLANCGGWATRVQMKSSLAAGPR